MLFRSDIVVIVVIAGLAVKMVLVVSADIQVLQAHKVLVDIQVLVDIVVSKV